MIGREVATDYIVYGPDISLFTRKLEAAMRFYGAPCRRAQKTAENGPELESRSGSHQVPVLRTPENWVIADTTPILDLLDGRFPGRRLFPEGPIGVLVHVVEEILDEWLARTMVHYRWHYEENTREVVSQLLGRQVSLEEAREFPLAKWGPRACRATGTESPHQQKQVEVEYLAIMDALEAQLSESLYALGNRPTAVDTILLGGLRAHTNADPVPDLSAYRRVLAWDAKGADEWNGGGELAPFPGSSPFAEHVLELGRSCYADFVLGNARALEEGAKAFEIETYGEVVSYLARPYPEQSRRMVQERIRSRLLETERREVGEWLEARGLAECFMP
jgi:glutathione S-transferase